MLRTARPPLWRTTVQQTSVQLRPLLHGLPTHKTCALLPAFTLAWRLDVAETIGSVVGEVVAGGGCRLNSHPCASPEPGEDRQGRRAQPEAGRLATVLVPAPSS